MNQQPTEKEILTLIDEAIAISKNAYNNYSKFPVGAVLIDNEGRKHKGVNFENASYGLTICAERNAIGTGITEGMKNIKIIVVTGNTPGPISPCGACRQVMSEFATEDTLVVLSNFNREYKLYRMNELLPYAFKF